MPVRVPRPRPSIGGGELDSRLSGRHGECATGQPNVDSVTSAERRRGRAQQVTEEGRRVAVPAPTVRRDGKDENQEERESAGDERNVAHADTHMRTGREGSRGLFAPQDWITRQVRPLCVRVPPLGGEAHETSRRPSRFVGGVYHYQVIFPAEDHPNGGFNKSAS